MEEAICIEGVIKIKEYTLKLNEYELETIGNALMEYECNHRAIIDFLKKATKLNTNKKAVLTKREKDRQVAYRLHYEFLKLRKPDLAKLYVKKGLIKKRGA